MRRNLPKNKRPPQKARRHSSRSPLRRCAVPHHAQGIAVQKGLTSAPRRGRMRETRAPSSTARTCTPRRCESKRESRRVRRDWTWIVLMGKTEDWIQREDRRRFGAWGASDRLWTSMVWCRLWGSSKGEGDGKMQCVRVAHCSFTHCLFAYSLFTHGVFIHCLLTHTLLTHCLV
jgi:hypothetical protein